MLAGYVALSFTTDPGGYLGTDTGAKVATLDVMEQRGTAKPVLGYWAEDFDPTGSLHPIYDAVAVDGDWVHVTTLPMLEAGRPLWNLGGYRLALVLPMLGAIGAAFAGRSLARRAVGDRAGWQAFWLIALGSPITVYALDFWEHAPGVACLVGAVALLAGVVDGSPVAARAPAAGALLGLGATMRTESFVYALVAVGGCVGMLVLQDRSVGRAVRVGAGAVAGFAGPWLANAALERALGGNSRADRVSSTAGGAFGDLGQRAGEAVTTLLALRPGPASTALLVGGLAALLGAGAVVLDRRGDRRRAPVLLAASAALQLLTVAGGLGFVPGMLAAAPIGLAALVILPVPPGARYALGVAVAAFPIVVAFQYLGGAGPQWAGRYALSSCIILVALGVAAVQQVGRPIRIGLLALTVLVSASGVLWLGERSRSVDDLFDRLVERPEDVIVVRNGFFVREGGDAYSDRLWLRAVADADVPRAAEVVRASGHRTFAVLDETSTAPARIEGAALVGTTRTSVVGIALYLHSYRF